jgi:tetratricopeptide (TPR) repeat protein
VIKSLTGFGAVILCCVIVFGQSSGRSPKREQEIRDKLAAVAPGAVETYRQATDALDKKDYSKAAQLYTEVVKQAPGFSPGLRRLAFCLAGMGKTDEALAMMRRAVELERTPENLISLAQLLAYPGENKTGTAEPKEQALTLAQEAATRGHGDPSYAAFTAQLALSMDRQDEFRHATNLLLEKYPGEMSTHYFNAILQALDGHWIASEDEIKEAERLGLPAEAAKGLLASGIHTRATVWRGIRYGSYVLAGWVCGLGFLFVAGKIFSKVTLRHIENFDETSMISSSETTLRKYYRALINVAGAYYYVSIPFVIVLVLAVAGGIVYGFLVIGEVPIKLVVILVIGALVTVYKMIHSLFVKVKSEDPGRSLTREEAPALWDLTREVAVKLGTRPLDEIRVTTGTDMAVYEQGTYRDRQNDQGKRTLILGLGLLPGFQ